MLPVDRVFYYGCFGLAVLVLYPVWTPLVTGIVLAYLCEGPVQALLSRMRWTSWQSRWLVAIGTVTLVQLVFITPLVLLASSALQELLDLFKLMDQGTAASAAAAAWTTWNHWVSVLQTFIQENLGRFDVSVSVPEVTARIRGYVELALRNLAGGFASVLSSTPGIAAFLFVSWISWIYFLAMGQGGRAALLEQLIPWQKQRELLGQTLGSVLRNMVLTSIVLSLVQSLMVTVALGLTGVPKFYLWGSLSFFLSFVPVVGTFPVMFASALYFFFNDQEMRSVVILGVSLLIGLSDNVLRPLLMKGSSSLSFFWLFLSLLGGVSVFGLPGVIIGPWALTLFVAVHSDAESLPSAPAENKP